MRCRCESFTLKETFLHCIWRSIDQKEAHMHCIWYLYGLKEVHLRRGQDPNRLVGYNLHCKRSSFILRIFDLQCMWCSFRAIEMNMRCM